LLKSHSCGELRKEHSGETVTLAGWVDRRRDHGGLTFIDLRDRAGVAQVVFNPEKSAASHEAAGAIRSEYVVQVTGEVAPRPPGTENPQLPTGEIEVVATDCRILNTSETPPFYINQDVDVDENLRLKYRYLDLRRSRMLKNLTLRHKVVKFIRDFLDERDFLEIETPILIKSTPEGARDYLVPSRINPGMFYALPQSPQQLKQLLMVAGVERYFQIARCFRDEDNRADRQPEHTQLDLEMSFVEEEDVFALMEELFTEMVKTVTPGKRVISPFPRISYRDAEDRYGSDRPDLRFGMEMADLSDIVAESEFAVFRDAVAGGGMVKGICVPDAAGYSRSQLQDLNKLAQSFGAKGLLTIALGPAEGDAAELTLDIVRSVAARFLTLEQVREMAGRLGAKVGDLLLIMAGSTSLANRVLSELRQEMGRRLGLADPDLLAFAFVEEFPLLRWDEEGKRWGPEHHPFTSPMDEDIPLLKTDPGKVRARCYDLICNGWELASGSIRIHTASLQRDIFRLLGYSDEAVQERFGTLIEAFEYGAPPHGGIAPGIDRLVMVLAGEENIREVMAFPKNQSATDLMFGAPSSVDEGQLAELHLLVREDE
jgi:aspartyl-tRNA synthetase